MALRAAIVAVIAVVLVLSSCSSHENLIVGDSADSDGDGEVSEGSASNEVRLEDLIGSVWLIAEISDGTTINDDLGGALSFIGSNDEPALVVGGPCGGGTLEIEPRESGIRIVRSRWDANCTGSDLQALFAPDTALELAVSEKVLTIRGNGFELSAKHVQSRSIQSDIVLPAEHPNTTAVPPPVTTVVVGPDHFAESATPTTAPLLSSTSRAWNVEWVANSAFHGAVVKIGPVVSQGVDYGPGGTSDRPTSVESGLPMVFRGATVLESSSGGLSGEIVLGDLDHAGMEVPYAPYVEGDVMFLFLSPQFGHTRPEIPIDEVFWVATNNDESKFDIVDDIATPRSEIVTALRKDDKRLEPGLVTFSVADLLRVTSEAAGCVFIGTQNVFC